ncbi:hypothetical protein MRO13_16700 [Vibrio metschnikovii]|uniref:hypothetical protein n=1 Tax=Vibrio metschnikovii TaxID=28172 RepID=UPI00333030ED
MLNSLRSPLHYTSEWALVHNPNLTALLKATPIFDPASIQLRGYMFIGLAIGQNRSFIQTLAERADLDALSIHYQQARLIQYSPSIALPAHSSEETTSSQMRAYENLYLLNATLNINNKAYPLNLKMGIPNQLEDAGLRT